MKQSLSPKELSLAIAASESSLKRWVDEGTIQASRTAGGHRRIALAEAVRFIRKSGIPLVRPDILGLADLQRLPGDPDSRKLPDEILQEALLAGQAPQARAVILSQYLAGSSVAHIWDHMIARAMRHIGTLWRHDTSGLHIEHRATDICLQAVQLLRTILPLPTTDSPVAVGGAPSGDPYALPSLMAAATAAAASFHDVNLGPETPVDVLNLAARHHRARLVWLAISVARPAKDLQREIDCLSKALAEHDTQLVIGGRAIPDGLVVRHANARIARTMMEFEAFALGLAAATGKR